MLKKFVLILLLCVCIRLPNISSPLSDGYSWRQGITASVARNFITEDANILHPKQNEILPETNFQRYFFMEFPLYEYLASVFYRMFGIQTWVIRFVTIFSVGVASIFLYKIAILLWKKEPYAVLTVLIFNLLPVTYFFGRTALPDMSMLMFLLGFVAYIMEYASRPKKSFLFIAAVLLSLASLIKPFCFVYLFILFALLGKQKISHTKQTISLTTVLLSCCIVCFPYVSWVAYFTFWYPSANPYDHVYGLIGFNTLQWWKQYLDLMLLQRFPQAFTTVGCVVFVVGLYAVLRAYREKRNTHIFMLLCWIISVLLYFLIVAEGNTLHLYYQLPLAPLVSLLCVHGGVWALQLFQKSMLMHSIKRFYRSCLLLFGCFAILCIAVATFQQYISVLRGLYWNEIPYMEEISAIQHIIPPHSPVIVSGMYRKPSFLDFTDRHGWVFNSEFVNEHTQPPEFPPSEQTIEIVDTVQQLEKLHMPVDYPLLSTSYYGYLVPFITRKKELGAEYLVLLKNEMPITFDALCVILSVKNRPLYQSNEVYIYSLIDFQL